MLRDTSFYIKLLLLTLLFIGNSNSIELSIIPLKKPILDKATKQSKLDQGIIRPKSKPIGIVERQKLSEIIIKPESKPSKQAKEIVTKVIEKEVKKIDFLIPKSKPLTVKGLFFGIKKSIFVTFFSFTLATISFVCFEGLDSGFIIISDNFCFSTILIGFDLGLIIP